MSAVSFDEAWEHTSNLSGMLRPTKAPAMDAEEEEECSATPRERTKSRSSSSGRRSASSSSSSRRARRGTVPPLDAADVDAEDLVACMQALLNLADDARELRAQLYEQQQQQKTTLYVALGVVVLLLLFVASTYSKLQYATDCLVHYRR